MHLSFIILSEIKITSKKNKTKKDNLEKNEEKETIAIV